MGKISIIAVLGPTGVGKTKLGVGLAKALNGEVISVDSLQVYRHGGLMTAKPTPEEMDDITHHLIDYLQPDQEPVNFIDVAISRIQKIYDDGKIPLLVGGSISLTKPLLAHPFLQQSNLSVILLHSKLSDLKPRLDTRIEEMVEQGLFQEMLSLYDLEQKILGRPDYSKGVWKSIGYRELRPAIDVHNKDCSDSNWLKGIIEMKKRTVSYAQEQMNYIWCEIVPVLQKRDLNFALFVVKKASTFEEQVIQPAVSECFEWLYKDLERSL
ncbi:hypothetical protein BKA66DRAFT_570653 [Pyrenochaeta sp. MPI-SDFR-AT-0127]|nr:hypothetical protein BKA66DRAFT_570653 [Pyrenochaeta sp. MPI-SDFR-AT-0127]